jgi:hypothetical protein
MVLVYVAMYIMSFLACIWTTVFAYISYKYERDLEYIHPGPLSTKKIKDRDCPQYVKDVVYRDIYPQFVQPLISRKLIQFISSNNALTETSPFIIYLELCKVQQLTPEEYDLFISLCMEVLTRRRSCYTHSQIRKRVQDVCAVYIWDTQLVDDLCIDSF